MWKYLSIIAVLALWASAAFAQGVSPRTVTVVGFASTQIEPDKVSWILTIVVRDDDQDKLRAGAEEILSQVRSAAGRLGIDPDETVFGRVTISMHYKQKNRRESDKFSHYQLTQRITLIQENIQRYDEFWYELTAIEGLRVGQTFIASQLEPTRRQMRMDALQMAKQKAEDLASVVGGSVGRALSISEFKPNPTQSDINRASDLKAVMGSGRPEKLEVSARVYVVFELQ